MPRDTRPTDPQEFSDDTDSLVRLLEALTRQVKREGMPASPEARHLHFSLPDRLAAYASKCRKLRIRPLR